MLTHDELVACLQIRWPGTVHGKDYWVGMPVEGGTQTGPAFIAGWSLSYPQPGEDEIGRYETTYATQIAAFRSAQTANAAVGEARGYLAATDWYVIRKFETGEAIPPEVQTKRAAARKTLGAAR